MHNAELHVLYSSPDIIRNLKSRRLSWVGLIACMELSWNTYKILVGKPKGKRPLGRPRYRWEDIIEMDLREVDCDGGNWIDLAQDGVQWWAHVQMISCWFLKIQVVS